MENATVYLTDSDRHASVSDSCSETSQKRRETCVCPRATCRKSMSVTVAVDQLYAVRCPHCHYLFELIVESGRSAA